MSSYFYMGTILKKAMYITSVEQFLHMVVPIKYHPYKALHKPRPFYIRHLLTNKLDPCRKL